MTTTTALTTSRDVYVERILQAYAQSFLAPTPTKTEEAIETAWAWAEAAESEGHDVFRSMADLEGQAFHAHRAAQ